MTMKYIIDVSQRIDGYMKDYSCTREEAEERTKEYLNDLEIFSNMIPWDYEIEVELKHL